MRNLLLLAVLLCFCVGTAQAQPKIEFDKTNYEFGYVLWRNPVKITYKVTNTGDKPLVISNVTTSCGCMEPDWTKQPILPGKTGEVSSTFDAEAIGHFHKMIGVYCNASTKPIYVSFTGEVTADSKNFTFTHPYAIGPIRLNKEEIEFDDVNAGDKPVFELLVANGSNKSYSPVLMHLPPYLSAKAVPEKLAKGKTGKILIELNTEKLPKLGITTSSVYLSRFMGDKVSAENEIPVSVVLLPDFSSLNDWQRKNPPVVSLSSTEIVFPALKPGQKKSMNVVLTNKGKSDLDIRDMQIFNTAVAVNLKKRVLKPGQSTKMKITVYADNLKRVKGTSRILMITNDPALPKISIRVKATLLNN